MADYFSVSLIVIVFKIYAVAVPRKYAVGKKVRQTDFFDLVSSYVSNELPKSIRSLCGIVAALDNYPIGLRRCFSVFWLDVYIRDDGFRGVFSNRFGCLASGAIEFYLLMNSPARASIIRLAINICIANEPDVGCVNNLELSDYALTAEPLPLEIDLTISETKRTIYYQIDELYYAEKGRLPGADRCRRYIAESIDWYAEQFPDDFPPELIAKRATPPS